MVFYVLLIVTIWYRHIRRTISQRVNRPFPISYTVNSQLRSIDSFQRRSRDTVHLYSTSRLKCSRGNCNTVLYPCSMPIAHCSIWVPTVLTHARAEACDRSIVVCDYRSRSADRTHAQSVPVQVSHGAIRLRDD